MSMNQANQVTHNLLDRITEQPEACAINLVNSSSSKKIVFKDIAKQIKKYAIFFKKKGLIPGEKVVLQVSDQLMDLVSFLSLSSIGVGVYVPSVMSENERRVISLLGIKVTVLSGSQLPATPHVVDIDECLENSEANTSSVTDLQEANALTLPWLIRSSSGTTGIPKIFITTHEEGIFRRDRYYDAVGIGPEDCFFSFTPLRFGAARQRIFYVLSAGASALILEDTDDLTSVISHINSNGVTHLYCVPMYLEILCDYAERYLSVTTDHILFPRVKSIETSSSIVSPSLRHRVTKFLNPNFTISYSLSEIGHISSTRKSKSSDFDVNDIGSVVQGVNVKIFGTSMNELIADQPGLIGVRFEERETQVNCLSSSGQWESLVNLGWFLTGDIGYFSQNNNLIFLGRSDDMIIFNGINIFPHEIETVILKHPLVSDVAVFALQSRIHNQVPCAAVILKSPFPLGELDSHCRKHLGSRNPKFIFQVDSFPRNPMGKILRSELQKAALLKVKK